MNNFKKFLSKYEILDAILTNPYFKKYEVFILSGTSVLIGIALITFIIIPQSLSLIDTGNLIDNLNRKTEFYKQKTSLLQQVNTDNYKNNIDLSLQALPEDRNIPNAIGKLLYVTNNSGLILEGMSFAPSGQEGSYSKYQIKIDVRGNQSQINQFITKINTSSRIFKIAGMEVTSGNSVLVNQQASITVNAYFQPLPAAIGSVDQDIALVSEKDVETLERIANLTGAVSNISSKSATQTPSGKTDPFE